MREIECDDCGKVVAYYEGPDNIPLHGITCARCWNGVSIGELLGEDGAHD